MKYGGNIVRIKVLLLPHLHSILHTMQSFIKRIHLNAQDKSGWAALIGACNKGHNNVV